MKAIILSGFGATDVLEMVDVEAPKPGDEQLLIRVHAAGMNRADLLQRRGKYLPLPGESTILGLEIAGEVAALGKNVTRFNKGDRVFGLVGGGAYAEYCVINQSLAMPIPDNFNYEMAAAVAEAFITANEAVFVLGELKSNENLLVHAAGSGVGTALVQMANYKGVNVYGTAGNQTKIDAAYQLGAKQVFNYKTDNFAEQLTNQHLKMDVIADFIGAEYLSLHLNLLNKQGRLIGIGLMGGSKAEINLRILQENLLQLKGFRLRIRTLQEKIIFTQRFQKDWLPVLTAGEIKPIIHAIYPLHEVRAAHKVMEKNLNIGKIILSI